MNNVERPNKRIKALTLAAAENIHDLTESAQHSGNIDDGDEMSKKKASAASIHSLLIDPGSISSSGRSMGGG